MKAPYILLGILALAVVAAALYYLSTGTTEKVSAPELSVGGEEINQIGAVNPEINLPADIGIAEENVGIDDLTVDVNDVVVDLPESI